MWYLGEEPVQRGPVSTGSMDGGDQGALWPLKDSGLTLGELGPISGFEQRKEVIELIHSGITLATVWGRNTGKSPAGLEGDPGVPRVSSCGGSMEEWERGL